MAAMGEHEYAVVEAAQRGALWAQDELVGAYLPLVYNIVGRALNGHADVDDVVQETMLRALRGLGSLHHPGNFRSWLVAITMNQIRTYQHRRQAAPAGSELQDAHDVADPGADFVDLTIVRLGLEGQRREVAEATRWLDGDDRVLLSLWWLEAVGELTRAEVSAALEVSPQHTAVRVQRMKAQLETARLVVRALSATPLCDRLDQMVGNWDGHPSPLWRKRIARHARECVRCSGHQADLFPAEGLLVGLGLVPVAATLTGLAGLTAFGGTENAAHVAGYGTADAGAYGGSDMGAYGGPDMGSYGGAETAGYGGSDMGSYSGTDMGAYGGSDMGSYSGSDTAARGGADPTADTAAFGMPGYPDQALDHAPAAAEHASAHAHPAAAADAGDPTTVIAPVRGAHARGRHGRPGRIPQRRRITGVAAAVAVLITGGTVATLTLKPDGDSDRVQSAPDEPSGEPLATSSAPSTPSASASPSPTKSASPSPKPSTKSPKPKPTPTPSKTTTEPKTTTQAPAPADPAPAAPRAGSPAAQVLALVNEERQAAGCGPLTQDARLARAAQLHSEDMSANNYFSHTSLDGRSFADRASAQGYPSPGAENIARGQSSAASVMESWMNSPGHRANILNCDLKTMGVGVVEDDWTWTQVFGF
ncbi:sigma-70 family RNA polymerase sigma factor [Streptomyces sp. FZ201]|uniref:sigma-70 family RNA polymerase sigma factor n=1 Tax=Streptomyces sp. FZ201 TaxID=3057122 RepID=UPI0021BF6AAE|nr:sigma-70 family RNA polymerase sigma factor [Streptomyces sp. FZ201]